MHEKVFTKYYVHITESDIEINLPTCEVWPLKQFEKINPYKLKKILLNKQAVWETVINY